MHSEAVRRFVAEVLESLFIQGLMGPHPLTISEFIRDQDLSDNELDPMQFVANWPMTIRPQPYSEHGIGVPSTTDGAGSKALAIHEAGHAIVALEVGLLVTGIWFYNGGEQGEAVIWDPDTEEPYDVHLVEELIAVDVAGNMAQFLVPGCEPPMGGLLSDLYSSADLTEGSLCPSDFMAADEKAHLLLEIGSRSKPVTDRTTWPEKQVAVSRAEVKARTILEGHLDALDRMSNQLMEGPMRGRMIRQLVQGCEDLRLNRAYWRITAN